MATKNNIKDTGMENIANRSPWIVEQPGKEDEKFRLKSQALAFLETLNNKRATIKQLETAFEVQIKLKDKDGNVIQRNNTFDTLKQAQEWRDSEKERILAYKKENGSFDISYETMTLEDALKKLLAEHYINKTTGKPKPSHKENSYRVPQIVEWLGGPKVLLRDINIKTMLNFRKKLEDEGYSASSIRNYFVIMTVLFKHAKSEWLFPIENPARDIKLPKPNNAIERNWKDDKEKERLFECIRKRSPWLLDLVELSLEMAFRLGELVPRTLEQEELGLQWEGIDFNKGTVRLFQEKNDHKKKNTESLGRTVPMTGRMREILTRLYNESETKKGRVFDRSVNSVGHAFKECCDQAEPPIKQLTFHSLRKIATYELSKKLPNPMMLSKITGHKDIVTLNNRYYQSQIEDLQAILEEFESNDVLIKGKLILERYIGKDDYQKFIQKVLEANLQDELAKEKSEINQ